MLGCVMRARGAASTSVRNFKPDAAPALAMHQL